MSDHDDLRRRAAQHASYGTYWAGKCVGLLDQLDAVTAELAALQAVVRDIVDDDCSYEEGTACRRWTPTETDAIRRALQTGHDTGHAPKEP